MSTDKKSTPKKSVAKKSPTNPIAKDVAAIWAGFATSIHLVYRPVTAREIAVAEKALKIRLPPSYIDLVTTVGAPAIAARSISAPDAVENLGYAVLRPGEIVKWTREIRASLDVRMAEDEEQFAIAKQNIDGAVLFQLGANAGEGFIYLLRTQEANGEMEIGDYSHDYIYELKWDENKAILPGLLAVTERVKERLAQHVAEVGPFRW